MWLKGDIQRKKWTFLLASSAILCIFKECLVSQPSKTKKLEFLSQNSLYENRLQKWTKKKKRDVRELNKQEYKW